jgi:hypothetical protein
MLGDNPVTPKGNALDKRAGLTSSGELGLAMALRAGW